MAIRLTMNLLVTAFMLITLANLGMTKYSRDFTKLFNKYRGDGNGANSASKAPFFEREYIPARAMGNPYYRKFPTTPQFIPNFDFKFKQPIFENHQFQHVRSPRVAKQRGAAPSAFAAGTSGAVFAGPNGATASGAGASVAVGPGGATAFGPGGSVAASPIGATATSPYGATTAGPGGATATSSSRSTHTSPGGATATSSSRATHTSPGRATATSRGGHVADEHLHVPKQENVFTTQPRTYEKDGLGKESSSYVRETESQVDHEDGRQDSDFYHRTNVYGKTYDKNKHEEIENEDENIIHTANLYQKQKTNTKYKKTVNKTRRESGSDVQGHDSHSSSYNKNSNKLNESVDKHSNKEGAGVADSQAFSSVQVRDDEEEEHFDSDGLGSFVGIDGHHHWKHPGFGHVAAASGSAASDKNGRGVASRS